MISSKMCSAALRHFGDSLPHLLTGVTLSFAYSSGDRLSFRSAQGTPRIRPKVHFSALTNFRKGQLCGKLGLAIISISQEHMVPFPLKTELSWGWGMLRLSTCPVCRKPGWVGSLAPPQKCHGICYF